MKITGYFLPQQWLVFARQWHIVDAKWQDPFRLADKVATILDGRNKPIFHEKGDCGDHVIIYNCYHVAMPAFDWRRVDFFFDNRFPKGMNNIPAWEIHQSDPCRVMWLAVHHALRGPFRTRPRNCERLHLFPEEEIPADLLKNVGNQLPQLSKQPKNSAAYKNEERENFPQLFDWPQDFVFEPGNV
uniref:Uncharacterized protein n=1 Tax=Romanomermis culicivorax TaxID=13658 RepID=A0A915KAG6_ROMCU